jgi:hypothetical protein
MKSIDRWSAELLVECGYAGMTQGNQLLTNSLEEPREQIIDPFADTLAGRRQANALEDWLSHTPEINKIWAKSEHRQDCYSNHQWRLDRIKWCIEAIKQVEE